MCARQTCVGDEASQLKYVFLSQQSPEVLYFLRLRASLELTYHQPFSSFGKVGLSRKRVAIQISSSLLTCPSSVGSFS